MVGKFVDVGGENLCAAEVEIAAGLKIDGSLGVVVEVFSTSEKIVAGIRAEILADFLRAERLLRVGWKGEEEKEWNKGFQRAFTWMVQASGWRRKYSRCRLSGRYR
jgi:hypothetical protein